MTRRQEVDLFRLTVVILAALLLMLAVGRVQAQDRVVYDDILYYGSDITGARLDVYLPAGVEAPYPTVVYVTPPALPDEGVLRYYAPHLIEQGYAAVGIRIRPQQMLPDTFCGLAWVHANAGEYGFDTQRIAAFGISGSGIPVATVGAIDRSVDNPFMEGCPHPEPDGPWVQGVVTFEAVFGTPVSLRESLIRTDAARFRSLPQAEINALFDLLIQTPAAEWRDIESEGEQYRLTVLGLPLAWIDGSEPPFLLIYGSASELGWMADEQAFFADYLESAGVSVEVVEIEGLHHSVDALAGHTEEMDAFLAEIFGGTASAQGQELEPITPGNVDRLAQVVTLGQEGNENGIYSIAWNPDGATLVAGSEDGTVRLWDVAAGSERAALQGITGWVSSVAFSPDGTIIAFGSDDNSVRVWDPSTNEPPIRLEGHSAHVLSVAFSPDGMLLASGSWDLTVRLWDVGTGETRDVLVGHTGWCVTSVAFSPDGTMLASGTADEDGTVRLWDASSGQMRYALRSFSGGVSSVAFNPDGTILASSGGNHTIWLWEVADGRERTRLAGQTNRISSLAFSADGQILAAGSDNGTIWLWAVSDQTVLAVLEGHTNGVSSVAFSPDGTMLATGGWAGTVRLWGVPAESQ